jgi:hypothetical protein
MLLLYPGGLYRLLSTERWNFFKGNYDLMRNEMNIDWEFAYFQNFFGFFFTSLAISLSIDILAFFTEFLTSLT